MTKKHPGHEKDFIRILDDTPLVKFQLEYSIRNYREMVESAENEIERKIFKKNLKEKEDDYDRLMGLKNPLNILRKIENTLNNNGVDFKRIITDLGQVSAAEKRSAGYEFNLNDHLEGIILSLLSNQRPWKQIADNLDNLEKIFLNYDAGKLQKADPEELSRQVKEIKCGNRNINRQMESIPYNIFILEKIEEKYGSIDNFITSKPVEEIAECLSDVKSPYKLKQMGMALTMEYLKNVGLSGMKPDTHLLRICGPERLNIIPETYPKEQLLAFEIFSKDAMVTQTYLDNLIWIFGAKEYGEICSSSPKCDKCELTELCNYPDE